MAEPRNGLISPITDLASSRFIKDIGWSDHHPHESNVTILDREVTLHDSTGSASDDAHLRLEKGCHEFEFVVIIPSSTPTYERCCWGRTRFRVVAKAKGLGSLGTDVSSVEKELFLVANVGDSPLYQEDLR